MSDPNTRPDSVVLPNQDSSVDWEQFISDEIIRILDLYQSIEIVLPGRDEETQVVTAHIPYMLQTLAIVDDPDAFAKLAQRHQDRLLRVKANRENAPEAVKRFLHEQFYDGDYKRLVACGRAGVEDIQSLLQAAVDQGLVPAEPDGYDLRVWLKHYGIGVDCSAFVQHALTRVMRSCYAKMGSHPREYLDYAAGWLRPVTVYSRLTADPPSSKRFENVQAPMDARPGDILTNNHHIQLVARINATDDSSIVLDLAESTSARDIPKGQESEENDIGSRMIQVQYPEPERPICEQSPVQKGPKERFTPGSDESSYILGRLKKTCVGHPIHNPCQD